MPWIDIIYYGINYNLEIFHFQSLASESLGQPHTVPELVRNLHSNQFNSIIFIFDIISILLDDDMRSKIQC